MVTVLISTVVVMLSLVLVAGPASAATWKVTSTDSRCTTYSFGTACTKTTYYKRTSAYCKKPPKTPGAIISWASYCLKSKTKTVWK